MRHSAVALAGCLLAISGCASGRSFANPPSGRGGGAPILPTPEPELGNPADSFGSPSGESSSFFRGGPKLRFPEALRTMPALGAPRVSARPESRRPAAPPPDSDAAPSPWGPRATTVGGAATLEEPSWSRFYRSTDRRVIETLQVGNGRRRVAIIGSLHGDETQSVALVEELARHLKANPELLRQCTVLLVKSPNPDGYFARSPYNLHGVDLNRNFPAANWKELQNARSGVRAASETETRALMRLLGDFKPHLCVHLKDSRQESIVNAEGDAAPLASDVARRLGGKPVQGLGAKTSGSIESYASGQLKCGAITLLLAREDSDQAAWARNRDGLLALLATPGQPQPDDEASEIGEALHPFDRPTMRQNSNREPQRPTKPAVLSQPRQSLPEFPAPVPEQGYFELPPP